MLVTSKVMLLSAQSSKYAVGAFNIENMEMGQAVIEAAQEAKAPVILQTTPGTLKYAGPAVFAGMVGALARQASVPVALHLDHGSSFELAVKALDAGYTSVMIDGSALPLEDNIRLTRRVAEAGATLGIPVEAELGKVGGKEDDLAADADTNTDPWEAERFARETGIDSLAVAIGTAHGFYVGTPVLDKARLGEIRKLVPIPLVLHGASGLHDKDVRDCIALGICKVNFATELRAAFTDGVKQALAATPDLYDPKKMGVKARDNVRRLVIEKIKMCGADGRA
ncbi:MAG: class II fructose-bisphosphate aldolase [Christensenellaceae bacterium]|nr:class II fructose-bisphosphate aldolase [Christensenellaceae bacterium]MEA5065936.1 class II fructose-bisphosphate aldolase [Eubacteriales bacterium]MEA5068761.1 class II fructose-bisphosphate aldolase [Christensenellaceae bacterium]